MKKLKNFRDILAGIWGISIFIRIFGKFTNLYIMPEWSSYVIAGIIFIVIILSIYIHFREKKENEKNS